MEVEEEEQLKFQELNRLHEMFPDEGPYFADFYLNFKNNFSDEEDTHIDDPKKKSPKNQLSFNKSSTTQIQTISEKPKKKNNQLSSNNSSTKQPLKNQKKKMILLPILNKV